MPVPADYVPLAGSERTPMYAARILAAADPNEHIHVTVMVRPQRSLAIAAARVNYDALPHERRHLTHEEYRAEHAADQADLAKVQEFAQAHHLEVDEVNDVQRSVRLTGTAADFATAFGVELHQYEYPGGTYRAAPALSISPKLSMGSWKLCLASTTAPQPSRIAGKDQPALSQWPKLPRVSALRDN